MLATANGFLDDVGNGRMESAYARTSARFRQEHAPEQFRALIDKNPLLKSQPSRQIKEYSVTATWKRGTASFQATLQVAKESQPVELRLITEEAAWKVDDLLVTAK